MAALPAERLHQTINRVFFAADHYLVNAIIERYVEFTVARWQPDSSSS